MQKYYLYLILIIIITIPVLNAQNISDPAKSSETDQAPPDSVNTAGQDTLYYEVFGMDCPGCHSMLEKQIGKLSAVQESTADWVKQQVMVIVKKDSVLEEKVLYKSIEMANFTPGKKKNK